MQWSTLNHPCIQSTNEMFFSWKAENNPKKFTSLDQTPTQVQEMGDDAFQLVKQLFIKLCLCLYQTWVWFRYFLWFYRRFHRFDWFNLSV